MKTEIHHFDDLLQAARERRERQRLLFVFAGAELPEDELIITDVAPVQTPVVPAALAEHSPTLVILELGANDGLRGLKPQLLADNLGAMIDAAHEAGARVLLVGMRMPPNYGPAYTRRFAEVFADVAEAKKVPLVPFLMDGFADRPELFLADGIHPAAEAQPRIVDTVWAGLHPLLVSDGRKSARR